MIGALAGDICGSRFEFNNYKGKDFELFDENCRPTDDSIMTLAVAQAILSSRPDFSDLSERAVEAMQTFGKKYPDAGYGGHFFQWIFSDNPLPYNSYGNGAAMRVSPCGFAAHSFDEAKRLSEEATCVTHNHPEGLKGAEAAAAAVYYARTGKTKDEIRNIIDRDYYPMNFTLDEIRPYYTFDVSCQGSVPQALTAFFESSDFEDAIRNAVSIGGDSDTIAAIAGGIAEAYYGVPDTIRKQVLTFLDADQRGILEAFESEYPLKLTER